MLDTDALARWLAARFDLPYARIDPLRVDVGRVAEVMSVAYAESRRALPIGVNATEVTVATRSRSTSAGCPRSRPSSSGRCGCNSAHPEDIARFTPEFYSLAASVRFANKTTGASAANSFEQLVELGKVKGQLDANDQGVVQVVDWLWQYAFEQRASDIHLEPRRDMARDPPAHRRRAAHRVPGARGA